MKRRRRKLREVLDTCPATQKGALEYRLEGGSPRASRRFARWGIRRRSSERKQNKNHTFCIQRGLTKKGTGGKEDRQSFGRRETALSIVVREARERTVC